GGGPLIQALTAMGQAPFRCPTPDGYSDRDGAWTATLMARWRFAASLCSNRLEGTRVEPQGLLRQAGGRAGLMAHLFGRRPDERERAAWASSVGAPTGLAILLASPAFQRC